MLAKKASTDEDRKHQAFREWITFKDEVKTAYRIDAAVRDETGQSGPSGAGGMWSCAFHQDKRASMSVRPQEGYFCCHTLGCNEKGDVFSFLSKFHHVSFKQAVLMAADRVGIEPPGGKTSYAMADISKSKPRGNFANQMNPAKLFESDLIPAFGRSRQPIEGGFFPVWHPGGTKMTPQPTVKKYKPAMTHVYRDMGMHPLMVILRCLHQSGDKYFMPIRIAELPNEAPSSIVDDREGRRGWMVAGTTAGHRKPIYGIERARDWIAAKGHTIMVVEGEKTCDAAVGLIGELDDADQRLTLSPMGGGNAALYADWTEFMSAIDQDVLDRLTFGVWPDADHVKKRRDDTEIDAQAIYVRNTIGAFVVAARKAGLDPSNVDFIRALPGTHRENGWDLADAKNEGWSGERVRRDIEERGMKMAIDKEFQDMDVSLEGDSDPAPFEDGPEDHGDLALSDLDDDDAEEEALRDALAFDEGEPTMDDIEDAEIMSDTAPEMDDIGETMRMSAELLGDPDTSTAISFERTLESGDVVAPDDADIDLLDNGEDDQDEITRVAARSNSHFRCLGYREGTNYFMSLKSGQIFPINYSAMRKQALLSLAPLEFWSLHFGEHDKGRVTIDWDKAISALIETSYNSGYWDPRKEAGQGARIDGGRVVFNTGDRVWYQDKEDGPGVVDLASNFLGEYHYTVGEACALPAFSNAFNAGDPEPRELLELIRKINWREETQSLSVMGLFGWLCIGPICGVLPWRPHLWLDGQRGSGKSWIIENIIRPTLGDYAINVKSNSTESGLRNILHGRAFPLVFDEAEGEMDGDSHRMKSILTLARHSATPGDSIVAQGVPGGNGQKFYSISSTFLLASITPQIEASADMTRFGRAKLGPGLNLAKFSRELEQPAIELLTQEFSSRMIARMVRRAISIQSVQAMMVRALTAIGLERRLADVWGTFAAGAWLLLEDGVPEDFGHAMDWIEETFGIGEQIREFADEIEDDKDHSRLIRHIIAQEVRCESMAFGARNLSVGALIDLAIGNSEDEDEIMEPKDAAKKLADIGIRLAHGTVLSKDGQNVDGVLIHKNSARIYEMLKATPYRSGYVDVIQQAEDVKNGPSVRFGGLGTYRSVVVPLKHLALSKDEE